VSWCRPVTPPLRRQKQEHQEYSEILLPTTIQKEEGSKINGTKIKVTALSLPEIKNKVRN
jgi:hypothetical protein